MLKVMGEGCCKSRRVLKGAGNGAGGLGGRWGVGKGALHCLKTALKFK